MTKDDIGMDGINVTATTSSVELSRQGGTAIIRLTRTARRGAIDEPTAVALVNAFERFDASDARVAIVTGEPGSFCAGADIGTPVPRLDQIELIEVLERALLAPARTSKPVIAAISGDALGGGFSLALATDLRVAQSDIRLGAACGHLGLFAFGAITALAHEIGHARATQLLIEGRVLTAREGMELGLIHDVVEQDVLEHALGLADGLANNSASTLRATKTVLNAARYRGFELERDLMLQVMSSVDAREGRNAFLEARDCQFRESWNRPSLTSPTFAFDRSDQHGEW